MPFKYYLFAFFQILTVSLQSEANSSPITETKIQMARSSRQIDESSGGANSFYFRGRMYRLGFNEKNFDDSLWACDLIDGSFLNQDDPDELNAVAEHVISLYWDNPDICQKYWIGPTPFKHGKGSFISASADVIVVKAEVVVEPPVRQAKYYLITAIKSETFCSVCVTQ